MFRPMMVATLTHRSFGGLLALVLFTAAIHPWLNSTIFAQAGETVSAQATRRIYMAVVLRSVNTTSSKIPTYNPGPYYVALNGSDQNPGTIEQPWRTVEKGLSSLRAGQTLYVRGGTYQERIQNPSLAAGTASSRVTVKAYPGERPVLQGLLWLNGLQYWTLDGINVTWDAATGRANEHMIKLTDGTGWHLTNAEIWGARSFAAIFVGGAPNGYKLSHLNIHDTYASNSTNQDHLIYVNTALTSEGGIIERSVLYNSVNGRAIKIGPPASGTTPVGGVTVRYNTMYNNLGPSNVQVSYGATNNVIYRNIMQKSGGENVTAYNLNGSGNQAYDNIGWEAPAVAQAGTNLAIGTGNVQVDPQFANAAGGDFRPLNAAVQAYGRFAP